MPDDIDSPNNQTIRDNSVSIPTPSLQVAGNEVVPDELVRDLLDQKWVSTENNPKPEIFVQDDKVQIDGRKNGGIKIYIENYQEVYEGYQHEFVNIEISVGLEIKTAKSRQRMWNMFAMCREIIYKYKLVLRPYHSIYFDGWQPEYEGPGNYSGIMKIRLTSGSIPAFGRRVQEEPSPNTDPQEFPDGT